MSGRNYKVFTDLMVYYPGMSVLPNVCLIERFRGDDPHFGDFQSD